jgi:hypothetical protein
MYRLASATNGCVVDNTTTAGIDLEREPHLYADLFKI